MANQNITSNWNLGPSINIRYNDSDNIWTDSNKICLQFKYSNSTVKPVHYSPQYGILGDLLSLALTLIVKDDNKCKSELKIWLKK